MTTNRHGMVQRCKSWFQRHGIPPAPIVLAGVSGGLDSMVLAETCWRAGLDLQVAHVNYGLRGDESNGDEQLVRNWCHARQIPCHVHAVESLSAEDGIQAEARKIRYAFFESTRLEIAAKTDQSVYIATAHHGDDQAETVLLNLLRGADPAGLAGMRPVDEQRHLLRPFLELSKSQLHRAATDWNVEFREDASNAKPDYLRNRIRIEGLPLLESFREGTTEHLAHWAERFQPIAQFLHHELHAARARCWKTDETGGRLNLEAWRDEPLHMEVLYQLAKSYGIGAKAVPELLDLTVPDVQSGASFRCSSAVVTRKKGWLEWSGLT